MQTVISTTKSRAHRTAIPAFAPVLRPPTGSSGIEVDDGRDIMVVVVMMEERRALGVVESRLGACSVGAGFVGDEAGRIRGVRTRVVVMSVELAIRQSACLRYDRERQT
jgi:hypothetical protein